MKWQDKLFIIVSILLVILFIARVVEKISPSHFPLPSGEKVRVRGEDSEIVTRLEKAGLEPKEAEYYKVID